MEFYYFERPADGDNPAGVTVSKTAELPEGEFQLDEYNWPDATLWFLADQEFTSHERQEAYRGLQHNPKLKRFAAK